jgi:hypothetical protein
MSYRIEYGSGGELRKPCKKKGLWARVAVVICVLSLVAGAMTIKNTGLSWVKTVLLPGDPAVTAAALENMAESIREGESLVDAVTAFCREIIENAG